MIEIIVESKKPESRQEDAGLETIYVQSVLGAAFRHFVGHIRGARVRFSSRDGECDCRIEIELASNEVVLHATGATNQSAFRRASEGLERRLFRSIYTDGAPLRNEGTPMSELAA